MLVQVSMMEAWTISKQKTRKWLLLRETNCFPGQQAVILDFVPYARFFRERQTEAEPPGSHGIPREAARRSCPACTKSPVSPSPSECPFVPHSLLLEPHKGVFSIGGLCRLMTEHDFWWPFS